MNSSNYTLIAAIAASVTATVSIIAILIQGKRWRVSLQTDLLLKLTEKFYSPSMRQVRRLAADKLLAHDTVTFEDVYELFDFFVLIGTLIKRKALSLALTYTMFEYWIVRYWHAAKNLIYELRTSHNDPEIYVTVERLSKQLDAYRRKRVIHPLSDEEVRNFLLDEVRQGLTDNSARSALKVYRRQYSKTMSKKAQ